MVMNQTLRGTPSDDPAWLFGPKYDGYRGLLQVTQLLRGER
jgi:ATP-dependent DNA ligase